MDNSIIRSSMKSVKMTYDFVQMCEYESLLTSTSIITGEKINIFGNIYMSTEGQVKKVKIQGVDFVRGSNMCLW